MGKKTICLDFDGVLHWYRKGWHDGTIYDDVTPGAQEAVDSLRAKGYEVVVHSTRCKTPDGALAVNNWLSTHGIKVDRVAETKPMAMVYVDDRALRFEGDWSIVANIERYFQTWTSRAPDYFGHVNGA